MYIIILLFIKLKKQIKVYYIIKSNKYEQKRLINIPKQIIFY